MKAYEHRLPTLVVGGKAGSFLGEYQAGGLIVVLNLTDGEGVSPAISAAQECMGQNCGSLPGDARRSAAPADSQIVLGGG